MFKKFQALGKAGQKFIKPNVPKGGTTKKNKRFKNLLINKCKIWKSKIRSKYF